MNIYDGKISLESLVEKNNLVVFDLENPLFSPIVFHMGNTWFIQFNEYHVYFRISQVSARQLLVYTTLTNLSTKYLMMCKVYTDAGGIKQLYHVCPPERKIIHSLKLMDYLHVQADNPWYNYYMSTYTLQML